MYWSFKGRFFMLEFRSVSVDDMARAKECLKISDFKGCEYSFANNLAWRRLYNSTVCFYGGFYISKSEYNGMSFGYPAGDGDRKALFSEMKKYSEHCGCPLRLTAVPEEALSVLDSMFPDAFEAVPDTNSFDYIYNISDLRDLPGGKYHKKRNHLKKINNYDFSYSELTSADFDDCITFAAKNYIAGGKFGESEIGEQYAINVFFEYFDVLGLTGGVLRVDGEVAAFTIGEKYCSDTVDIHIEKADKSIEGAYQAINNFYVRSLSDDILYINREDDMGIEGLRKSKLSYYPAFMLKKYIVTFK